MKKNFDWVYEKLANEEWKKYGVTVVNEQTAYHQPGNSHALREASAELQYIALTKDSFHFDNAIRQLKWATYIVDDDGRNRYPNDANWLTDGHGDYVRHFLRAIAAIPYFAPSDEEHILSSTSVIEEAAYALKADQRFADYLGKIDPKTIRIFYRTFDTKGIEQMRLLKRPSATFLNLKPATELKKLSTQGFKWDALDKGGILTVKRMNSDKVNVVE